MRQHPTFLAALLLLCAALTKGCACSTIEQGYTGVLAHHYGDEKGGIEEKGPGRHHYNLVGYTMYRFPNFVQRVVWTADRNEGSPVDEGIRVLSRDQLEFVVDVGFAYYVAGDKGCSAALFRKYRKDITTITNGPIRDIVRNAIQEVFSQHAADYIYGEGRPEVIGSIEERIRRDLSPMKGDAGNACFILDNFSLIKLDPPNSVKQAVERKIAATQRAQEERENLMRITYEAQQDSIKAVMDARNNRLLSESITPELIEYERLQLMKEKWDGKLPQVMSGDGGGLLLNLDR